MGKATVQGLSEDLRSATGDFGSIDLGEVSEARLKKIFEQVSRHSTPPEVGGKERCPPSLPIETRGDIISFTMDEGTIYCTNAESEAGLDEAVAMATGKLSTHKKAAARGIVRIGEYFPSSCGIRGETTADLRLLQE